ncbi:MAG: hypothetical protein HC866_26500, partial [Leptolyngbyaceae cyanobacterium RU_5_1]|nr:hypothetical protein [Leptolyngbyaceae cyanobacterium RU_5_1]
LSTVFNGWKEKGAWILGTRGTAWQLEQPTGTILLSDAESKILRTSIQQLEGHALTSLSVDYPALSLMLSFSENYRLTVTPFNSDDDFDLPYWELFTPEHQVLQVGPRARWSLMQSNQRGLGKRQEN